MAGLILGGLKTLGTTLLGDLAKEGIETIGSIAKNKLNETKQKYSNQATPAVLTRLNELDERVTDNEQVIDRIKKRIKLK